MATLIKQVQGFTRAQGNAGKNGLALILTCMDHFTQHNDWTPLAWLLAKTEGGDSGILRRIVRETYNGATISTSSKEAKEQPSGMMMKFASNAGPTEKMDILRKLVEDGESFRGKAVKAQLFETQEKAFDLVAYAKRLQTKLDKEGVSVADLLKAFEPTKPAKSNDDLRMLDAEVAH